MSQVPDNAEFVSLLTSHQRRLFGYVATLLPNPTDTEEVLQQTNLVLWAKASEFEPGTSFRAWAFRIAYLEVIAYCRRGSRERRLFGSELVETMSHELSDRDAASHQHSANALRLCLEKLPAADRALITDRYAATGGGVSQMATNLGRSVSSVYRSLDRIRYALLECIRRTLATEEGP